MTDYKIVNIVDAPIEDITSELTLPIITATDRNDFQTIGAQSQNTTMVAYNVNVPSLATGFRRDVLNQATMVMKIDFAGGSTAGYWAPNQVLFEYGKTNALQAFPFNSAITNSGSNINSANVTCSLKDVMPALLKMCNYEELAKTNSLCPSLIDSFYYNYRDGINSNSNVLSNYSSSTYAKEYQPRGCFPAKLYSDEKCSVQIPLTVIADTNGTNLTPTVYLKFTSTEPLLFLSPYSTGVAKNQALFIGINGLTFTFTLNATAGDYMMSNASYGYLMADKDSTDISKQVKTISGVKLNDVMDCRLLFNYQTIPATLYNKLAPQNVLPYQQYMPYQTTNIPNLASNAETTVTSNSVQFLQMPSKILIYVKAQSKTSYDSNNFAVIESINVNFCNQSGLLSGCTRQQLYNISVENGLNMNYYEFSGVGVSGSYDGSIKEVPTIGSIIVLDPAKDLSIPPQFSTMSGGQFTFFCTLKIKNQGSETMTIPTIYTVCVNNGIFVTKGGNSLAVTGMLSQEQVLDTKGKEAIMDTHSYNEEVVGGSLENIHGAMHKHIKKLFSRNSEKEKELDHEAGEQSGATQAISDMNAGAMSAGSNKRIHKYTK